MREAEQILSKKTKFTGNFEDLEEQFKNDVYSQFQNNFVSSGNVQLAKTEATIKFSKKDGGEVIAAG